MNWFVIPSYNEAQVIREVVDAVIAAGHQVVLVDDASSDNTAEVLAGSGVHYCCHPINLGQGAALQTGIEYAVRHGAQYIITFDADGQHRLEDAEKMLAILQSGETDLVLGSRFCEGGDSSTVPFSRRMLLRLATIYTRFWCRIRVTDTHNGLRGMTAETAKKIKLEENRMGHATEILRNIRQHQLRYQEVPVTINYTEYSIAKGQRASNAVVLVFDAFKEFLRR